MSARTASRNCRRSPVVSKRSFRFFTSNKFDLSPPWNDHRSHNGAASVIAYSNISNVPSITIGTAAVYSKPKDSPARRTRVVIARTEEPVTGPRISHLNNLRFTTRSGQKTPKKATEYAMMTRSTTTKKLFNTATSQNNNGWLAAKPDPKSRNG